VTLTRRLPCRWFSLLSLALLAAASAQAADNYLNAIPSTALAWGAVNHMGQASDKIQKLAAVVQAPAASMLDELKKEVGLQKGVDEEGAAGFFVVPGKTPKDACATALFVAVTDEKEILDNFDVVKAGGKVLEVRPKAKATAKIETRPQTKAAPTRANTSYLALRNGYAVLSPHSDRLAVETAVEAKQSIAAEMAGLESWLAENDGSLVGTAAGIEFAAKQAAQRRKQNGGDGTGAVVGSPRVAMMFPFLDLQNMIPDSASREFALVAAGIRCDKQSSISILGRARLVNGGLASLALSGIQPATEKLLSGVPGGSFFIAVGGLGLPKQAETRLNLAAGLVKSVKSLGLSGDDAEHISSDSWEVIRQIRSMNYVMKTSRRGDPILSNMFSTVRVDDSQRFIQRLEKLTENINKFLQDAKPGTLKAMTAKRLEIVGKPALQQELAFDLASMAGPGDNHDVMDEVMGIGGKMIVYHVAADAQTVVSGLGVSQERMAAALDVLKQPKKSLAEDSDVAVTAAMLPTHAQWVAYLSPNGYMQLTLRIMTATMKNFPQAMAFTLPQFPKSPPIGFAVQAAPTEVQAQIAVPAPLVEAFGQYIKDEQKMIMERSRQNQAPVP
jgi:hypothetical protein